VRDRRDNPIIAKDLNLKRLFSVLVFAITFKVFYFEVASVRLVRADVLAIARYVTTSGNDTSDCSSIAAPCRTIQYAVNQASSGDKILVAQGTYTYNQVADPCPFLYDPNIGKDGRAVVCIVDKALTILGGYSTSNWLTANPKFNLTIVDGQNSRRGVFLIGYSTTTASLDMEGFTIQNSRVLGPDNANDPSGFGGGMMVAGARVTLRDMNFKSNKVYGANTSSGAGGAAAGSGLEINWSQPGTSNLLERVTFDGNQSFGGTGPDRGGLAYGALFVNGSVTIDYGTFTNNQANAASSSGSGRSGNLNADALGGAIGGGGGSWALGHIIATGNQAVGGNGLTYAGGGFGGAIHVESANSFSMTDSYVSDNLAQGGIAKDGGFGAGGGILINNTPATLSRVQLVSNNAIGGNATNGNAGAGGGGGLYLWMTSSGPNPTTLVTNAMITDNYVTQGSTGNASAGGGGGGIQVQGLQATITHCTIARNRLGPALVSGQGLLILASPGISFASANVNYSIIADHTEGGSGAAAVLVQPGNAVTFSQGLFAGNTKDTNASGGPVLPDTFIGLLTMLSAPSADFISPSSPNYNYHLRVDSVAKDQAIGSTTNDDIDGQSRPYNSVSDFGADEYWPFSLNATLGNHSLRLDWEAGASVLTGGLSRYEGVVTCPAGANPPDQGPCGQPINVGTATTLTLTGLSTYKQYTIVVNARDASQNLIATSSIMTISLSDIFLLYLPLIVR